MLLTDDSLLQYKRCHLRTFLDFYGDKSLKSPQRDFCQKLKKERISHSRQTLNIYNRPYKRPSEVSGGKNDVFNLARITEEFMRQGVECIYQGVLRWDFNFEIENQVTVISSPTLLIKDETRSSRWGNWSYYPVNNHLGKSNKKEYKLISGLHANILGKIQEKQPARAEIILRSHAKTYNTVLSLWIPRSEELVAECVSMLTIKDEPALFISRQRCSFCHWYDRCYDIAKSENHLSLIPGITPSKLETLYEAGITDFDLLTEASIDSLQKIFPVPIAHQIYKQTLSLRTNSGVPREDQLPILPYDDVELYFDIETEPDRNVHYLLGVVLVDRQQNHQEYYSFLAKNRDEEKAIWQEFVKFMNQYPNSPIFHYSSYETEVMKHLANLYHTPNNQLQSLLDRSFDLHQYLVNSFYLPVQNYSLKSVANWMGFYWRDPVGSDNSDSNDKKVSIAGDQCVFWYDQWLQTNEYKWLEYILIYNHDDCYATYKLKKWLDFNIKGQGAKGKE